MRRLGGFALLLAGTAILATAAVFWFAKPDAAPLPPCVDANQHDGPESADLFFRLDMRGSGVKRGEEEFGLFDMSQYTSEDGISVWLVVQDYRSKNVANKKLSEMILGADEVIERGPRFDGKGERTGEKAVLKTWGRRPDEEQAVVAWTRGSSLWTLASSSLRHSLLLYDQRFGQPGRMSVGDMQVRRVAGGETLREGALKAYVTCLRFDDGMVVKRTIAEYESITQSNREMERVVNQAFKVLIRRPEDEEGKGKMAPQLVLLRMPPSHPRESQAFLVRNYGRRIVIHESSSFRHALWGLYYEPLDPAGDSYP